MQIQREDQLSDGRRRIRRAILFTLGALVCFRMGHFLVLPGFKLSGLFG